MPVAERVVAFEHVGAAELVAGHSAGHSGADVAGVAELQLAAVVVAAAAAVAAGERELALALVVLAPYGPVVAPVFVHSDEFVAGLVVGGRVG